MRLLGSCLALFALSATIAGCAAPVHNDPLTTGAIAYAARTPDAPQDMPPALQPAVDTSEPSLAGRVLEVGSESDLVLNPHEVILTFDDGPNPRLTPEVLAILRRYGVKATFMMVGRMAQLYPGTAQQVALAGETIGTHTFAHSDLAKDTRQAALDDIRKGQEAITAALAPIGARPSPFFRFPYLATTPFLKASLVDDHVTVLNVGIDSKDYYSDTPAQVLDRLLARLDHEGKGIVLMHDIHPRTIDILPGFLDALRRRGYTVVDLVAKPQPAFGIPVRTASAKATAVPPPPAGKTD